MDDPKTSDARTPAATLEAPERLAGRAAVYAVLARGFSQPDESVAKFFGECGDCGERGECGDREAGEVSRLLGEGVAAARSAPLGELQAAYIRLFDPVSGPFPYESEHRKGHEFSKAHILADIMGFYRAFGVLPDRERCDHVATQLEFMHLLTIKEAHAAQAGDCDHARLCRDAARGFFAEHVANWSEPLAAELRGAAGARCTSGFYPHLIDLFEVFVESEKENFA